MTADDAFFLDFLPGSKAIPELSKQFMDQLIALPDRAVSTFHHVLDKIDVYLGRQHSTAAPLPFLAPPQDPSTLERLQLWITRNKVLVAVVLIGSGAVVTGFIVKHNAREMGRKRRAKRFANGQRKEAVVITGVTTDPLTRSVALDLERRGFVVFCAVPPSSDALIEQEGKHDLRALPLDIAEASVDASLMVQAALGQRLHLAGLILSSSAPYPTGPIETITTETWNETLQSSVLGPISLIQSFLPLLRTQPASKIVFLTPSIIPSLHPPFNAPATITHSAISSLALTLSRELPTIPVVQINLGIFDLTRSLIPPSPPAATPEGEIASWPSQLRGLYDKAYQQVADRARRQVRGGNVRELHNTIFDVLTMEKAPWWRGESRVWGVGSGVGLYAFIGKCVPESLVSRFLGEPTDEGWVKVEKAV